MSNNYESQFKVTNGVLTYEGNPNFSLNLKTLDINTAKSSWKTGGQPKINTVNGTSVISRYYEFADETGKIHTIGEKFFAVIERRHEELNRPLVKAQKSSDTVKPPSKEEFNKNYTYNKNFFVRGVRCYVGPSKLNKGQFMNRIGEQFGSYSPSFKDETACVNNAFERLQKIWSGQ